MCEDKDNEKLRKKIIEFDKAISQVTEKIDLQYGRIPKLEAAIKKLQSGISVHITLILVVAISGLFLLVVSINSMKHASLIVDGKLSTLRTEEFGWLLAHDALLAITGVAILGISLFVASRFDRD